MGTSLGANAALEVASAHPERLRGLVIEMPVLDNGLLGSALAFTPLLVALTFGEPVMKLVARVTRAVPRRILPHYGNVMLDVLRQEPGPGGALLQGLFFGRIAPPRDERATFQTPALVLGHPRDPVHPFSDAGMLAQEMPNARLLEADSLVELRMQPEAPDGARSRRSWTRCGRRRAKRARNAPQRRNARASAPDSASLERTCGEFDGPTGPPSAYSAGNSSSSLTLTWPGACAVPTGGGGLADPQRDEVERLVGVFERDAHVLLLGHAASG